MTSRIPSAARGTPQRARGASGAANQAQGDPRDVNAGGEQGAPAVGAAPAQHSNARRARRPHPLQQAARDREAVNRVAVLNNALQVGYALVKDRPQVEVAERMLDLNSRLIDAIDQLPPRLTHQVVSEAGLANVLYKRFACRETLMEEWATLGHRVQHLTRGDFEQLPDNEVRAALRDADSLFKAKSENVVDLRRVLALQPGHETALNELKQSSLAAVCTKTLLISSRLAGPFSASGPERMIGDKAILLERQDKLVTSALAPVFAIDAEPLSEDWVALMRPVLNDLGTVCSDLAATIIDVELPEPSAEHGVEEIARVKDKLESNLYHCSDMAHVLMDWGQINAAPAGVRAAARARHASGGNRTGDLVAVLAPSGLHVPAKIQGDGNALSVGREGLLFEPLGSDFHCVGDVDSEGDSDSELGLDPDEGTAPSRFSARAVKSFQKGIDFLAHDVEKEIRDLTWRKGHNDPDISTAAYRYMAEQWETQAKRMGDVAGRLDRFSPAAYESEEQGRASMDLPQRLRERADTLMYHAQELVRPETRWTLIKAYPRPRACQWAELLRDGQVQRVSLRPPLPSTPPNTLFELRIQPKADADGASYPPVWLHLHARKPMTLAAVRKASLDNFAAAHLKSDIDKNRGAQWIEEQRRSGRYDVDVHRSPIDGDLLKTLMQLAGRK